ncbi:predicted protein [Chaetomium globosum CBS 148.51]|uniref:Uncharacterized protein n=1 Tax=Chaetomium globosum (strain ATCC 6205 / CBS 148.51 / DSM 1962 / NBRC 6347 / NRRL 1970) TaxID=306901 RepID=Q2H3Z5_CHAGB|nr:uncharacterized protein CHGG_06620 [Chaetomium globosum CBS 148.51]EAQ90001.1 predicted protein [Chaetomium globosum CBS 148.51]
MAPPAEWRGIAATPSLPSRWETGVAGVFSQFNASLPASSAGHHVLVMYMYMKKWLGSEGGLQALVAKLLVKTKWTVGRLCVPAPAPVPPAARCKAGGGRGHTPRNWRHAAARLVGVAIPSHPAQYQQETHPVVCSGVRLSVPSQGHRIECKGAVDSASPSFSAAKQPSAGGDKDRMDRWK